MAVDLDLDDAEARIERHRQSPGPKRGTAEFLDLSWLIDHDAPRLLAEVKRHRRTLNGLRGELRAAVRELNAGHAGMAEAILSSLLRTIEQDKAVSR